MLLQIAPWSFDVLSATYYIVQGLHKDVTAKQECDATKDAMKSYSQAQKKIMTNYLVIIFYIARCIKYC